MQEICTDSAPAAIGSYSQAIRAGNTVYISGQIALDKDTMSLCSEEIDCQIKKVIENLQAICNAAGGSLANLVKINVYLTDLSHFALVNSAMEQVFVRPYPARALVQVSALPKGAKIEMDAIMILAND